MPIKFVDRYKEGFQVIVEVVEGEYLLGGRSVSDGTVCDTFREALNYRKVKVWQGGAVQRDGVYWCARAGVSEADDCR